MIKHALLARIETGPGKEAEVARLPGAFGASGTQAARPALKY
ncbi:hypothetical protein [Massilia antarctica]|nr:hypothetical protein [Massilia sp. H27-R4]MCY0911651.1 hypothetical protein [Massilia sp. H27-R4]CUI04725.1 hypothetical protein BN2497_4227 [Janthinobacterium sp. CG23_2]CUU28511.1 hypothetical protein BN3177_4227 [Janthinobacterium sp. CG23_2]